MAIVVIPVTRLVKGYSSVSDPIIAMIRITSRFGLAMSVCPYERYDLGNYKSCNTGIRHGDSRDSCAAQVCFVKGPRPLKGPQSTQYHRKL